MAGTSWRLCPECLERSRDNRAWWCQYCDYLKPKVMVWDVKPIPEYGWVVVKPRKVNANVAARAKRKAEKDKLAEDIDKLRKPRPDVISGLRLKAGLRRL